VTEFPTAGVVPVTVPEAVVGDPVFEYRTRVPPMVTVWGVAKVELPDRAVNVPVLLAATGVAPVTVPAAVVGVPPVFEYRTMELAPFVIVAVWGVA
jgi:hypothetical protein